MINHSQLSANMAFALIASVIVPVYAFTAFAVEPSGIFLQDVPSPFVRYQAMMMREKMEATSTTTAVKINQEEDSQAVDMETIMSECNETFRIDMDYLVSLNESGSFPNEEDKTPKCYMRCVLERAAVVSAEGTFDAGRAAQAFRDTRSGVPATDVEEIAAACALREETCKCERSYSFVKCLMEAVIRKYDAR